MEAMGFMAPASFVREEGPTNCGLLRPTSSNDHFLLPEEARRLVGKVRVCWRLGRVVQLAPCQQAVDHMPLLLGLHHSPSLPDRTAGNFGRPAAALQTGKGSAEFLEDLQSTMQEDTGKLESHS